MPGQSACANAEGASNPWQTITPGCAQRDSKFCRAKLLDSSGVLLTAVVVACFLPSSSGLDSTEVFEAAWSGPDSKVRLANSRRDSSIVTAATESPRIARIKSFLSRIASMSDMLLGYHSRRNRRSNRCSSLRRRGKVLRPSHSACESGVMRDQARTMCQVIGCRQLQESKGSRSGSGRPYSADWLMTFNL